MMGAPVHGHGRTRAVALAAILCTQAAVGLRNRAAEQSNEEAASVVDGPWDAAAWNANNFAPSLIVAGIGESGTTGTIKALEELGLVHCRFRDITGEPPWAHYLQNNNGWSTSRSDLIVRLLKASKGTMSEEAYSKAGMSWSDSLTYMRQVAEKDYKCILDERKPKMLEAGEVWGYKEPHFAYLIPAITAAFRNRTKVLLVVRDPRDICTGWMQDQLAVYGPLFEHHQKEDCFAWWAGFWNAVLDEYEHSPQVKFVRIESLVLADSALAVPSMETLRCVVEFTGMVPKWDRLAKAMSFLHNSSGLGIPHDSRTILMRKPQSVEEDSASRSLEVMHGFANRYMGHHEEMDDSDRAYIESSLRKRTDMPVIHNTVRRLGYRIDGYGLAAPESSSVCER